MPGEPGELPTALLTKGLSESSSCQMSEQEGALGIWRSSGLSTHFIDEASEPGD